MSLIVEKIAQSGHPTQQPLEQQKRESGFEIHNFCLFMGSILATLHFLCNLEMGS
jgi:hypothetical protein